MTTKQNQKYTFTYQQSDSNRQAIIDNKPSEFKTTPAHATERSMWEVAKSGPFACPCPLMYAEKYDEAMWFRARDEYLTQKKYEDDETIRELKQENRNSQMERPFNLNLADQILYGALANSSGFGDGSGRSSINCIADRVRTAEEEIQRLNIKIAELEEKVAIFDDPEKLRLNAAVEKLLEQDHAELECDGWAKADEYQEQVEEQEEQIAELKKENEELKRKVQLQELGGYYCHTRPAPDCEINTDDAAFDHYWSVQDNDLTLWKVPRHLADVPSAQTGYHGAVEQAFYDECFGEEYGKLKWMRVREMTQADLIKGGWEPETNEDAEDDTQ